MKYVLLLCLVLISGTKFNLENLYKGIETIPYFHQYFAEG
jgi:hypothetical protein